MNSKRILRRGAAMLAFLTAGVHTILGGSDALLPMLNAGLVPAAESALHASWHIVAAFLMWSGVVFWNGGRTARHFAGLWIASAFIFVGVSLWQDGVAALAENPQWTILGVTGILAWFVCIDPTSGRAGA